MSGKALDELSSNLQYFSMKKVSKNIFLPLEFDFFGSFSSGDMTIPNFNVTVDFVPVHRQNYVNLIRFVQIVLPVVAKRNTWVETLRSL